MELPSKKKKKKLKRYICMKYQEQLQYGEKVPHLNLTTSLGEFTCGKYLPYSIEEKS